MSYIVGYRTGGNVQPMFDARAFLTREYGSPKDVLRLFDSYGLPAPPLATIQKWYQRGSVSGAWLASLVCVLELERGQAVTLAHYLKKGTRHARRV